MNKLLQRFILSPFSRLGVDPADSDELRLQKSLMVAGSMMFLLAGAIWGVTYILLGETLAGLIPLFYAGFSTISLGVFSVTRRFGAFRFSQLLLILLLPFLLQLALGGYISASAVVLWSLLCPVGALLFAGQKNAWWWAAAYTLVLVVSGLLQPYLRMESDLPLNLVILFFVLNLGAISLIVVILLNYFITQKDEAMRMLRLEQERSESLLLNILPQAVAQRLKEHEAVIADHYDSVSILFADLVGFTPLSAALSPAELVERLNVLYSKLDVITEKYRLEKIRTIGDSYMVASGLPTVRADHAQRLARAALEMNDTIAALPPFGDHKLISRMGISSGPVVAGVIGQVKFHYDVWGDTVNTASRMESHGQPGGIQISRATYELIKNEFVCEYNGVVQVKGKGDMVTWFLVGEQPRLEPPDERNIN